MKTMQAAIALGGVMTSGTRKGIEHALTSTYLRGFRDAVGGLELARDVPGYGAYVAGFSAGLDALETAKAEATGYADFVLRSAAMQQAEENARGAEQDQGRGEE